MNSQGTSALRRGRTSIDGQIYHLIGCTHNRTTYFAQFALARSLVRALNTPDFASQTLCYVVMPDHFHWLVQFDIRDVAVSKLVQRAKAKTASFARQKSGIKRLWQKGFYDRAIRKEEDLPDMARYIVANPIRAGLVSSARMYPHWDAVWLEP